MRRAPAARGNAAWCDAVCRSHGLEAAWADDAWTCATRTPPLYPDAVTLAPGASAGTVLDRVDATTGCSVKDSFADLDLGGDGFHVLFEAEWIERTAEPGPHPGWEVVTTQGSLADWARAWGPQDVFRPALLDEPGVTFLVRHGDAGVTGGAILHRSGDVVGISNVFGSDWAGCLGLAGTLLPGATLVGYESADELAAARAHGFTTSGPLRVWVRGERPVTRRRPPAPPAPRC